MCFSVFYSNSNEKKVFRYFQEEEVIKSSIPELNCQPAAEGEPVA